MIKIAIVGGSGYVGGELIRLLLSHPKVEVNQITSRQHAGRYIVSLHPHLRGRTRLKFVHPDELEPVDLLFLAMPHGVAMRQIKHYQSLSPTIIDLSADFRLNDLSLYKEYYQIDHQNEELLDQFVYGVVEKTRDEIKSTDLISSAGCNATASILGLWPLIEYGIDIEHITIDVKVGTSEGGRSFSAGTHHPERSGSIRSYQVSGHRHSAEIIDQFYENIRKEQLSFSATALDSVRGVLATIHINANHELTEKDLWKIYRNHYKNEPFIRIVKERTGYFRYPDPKLLVGTNYCDIGFEIDPHTNRIVVLTALDNLIKGAAGQAIQAMNVRYGWDEQTALTFAGLFP